MESILKPLKKDLLNLYNEDYIKAARLLNKNLVRNFISDNCKPMYFTGKYDAATVFIMLNPGAKSSNYSFKIDEKNKYLDFDDFYQKYVSYHINYGFIDKNRMDNFDLKQAAFLFGFKDSGINIPDFIQVKEKEIMLRAKENVLMNKLQLELIPYLSVEFVKIFDNLDLALKHIDFFAPHIKRILDTITFYERKYVIFGAKQFYYLFQAYKEKGYGQIEFGTENNCKI